MYTDYKVGDKFGTDVIDFSDVAKEIFRIICGINDTETRKTGVDTMVSNKTYAPKKEETGTKPSDAVNHPSWYGSKDDPYETIKVIEAWGLNFTLGNALKYISRAGKKDPAKTVEDLRKALFYIQYEIDRLEGKKV